MGIGTGSFNEDDDASKEEGEEWKTFSKETLEIKKKVISTRASQAVPHLSTNLALNRLTSEFEWDPVLLA